MKFPLSKLPLIALLATAFACTPAPRAPQYPERPVAAPLPVNSDTNPAVTRGMIPANTPSVKVALLLPLSGESRQVGNAMMDAALMALSDSYLTVPSGQILSQVVLIPKDTGNSPAETEAAALEAINQGAQFIIGPLFSQTVPGVAAIAKEHHIGVLSFSNNKSVASGNTYVFGFLPEQQIERIAEYAYLQNLPYVALMAPNDTYGQKVRDLLAENYSRKGGVVSPIELYAPSPVNIDAAVARLVRAYSNMPKDRKFKAIFIADGGSQMKYIIDAFKRYNFDLSQVKLLGTGLWDDPNIARIPEMAGAWFPSSPPGPYKDFETHFQAVYGYKPIRLASLAYDAVTLIASLTMQTRGEGVNTAALTDPGGFNGPANGLFRLNLDGTCERKLAILEITPEHTFRVIDTAPLHF